MKTFRHILRDREVIKNLSKVILLTLFIFVISCIGTVPFAEHAIDREMFSESLLGLSSKFITAVMFVILLFVNLIVYLKFSKSGNFKKYYFIYLVVYFAVAYLLFNRAISWSIRHGMPTTL